MVMLPVIVDRVTDNARSSTDAISCESLSTRFFAAVRRPRARTPRTGRRDEVRRAFGRAHHPRVAQAVHQLRRNEGDAVRGRRTGAGGRPGGPRLAVAVLREVRREVLQLLRQGAGQNQHVLLRFPNCILRSRRARPFHRPFPYRTPCIPSPTAVCACHAVDRSTDKF